MKKNEMKKKLNVTACVLAGAFGFSTLVACEALNEGALSTASQEAVDAADLAAEELATTVEAMETTYGGGNNSPASGPSGGALFRPPGGGACVTATKTEMDLCGTTMPEDIDVTLTACTGPFGYVQLDGTVSISNAFTLNPTGSDCNSATDTSLSHAVVRDLTATNTVTTGFVETTSSTQTTAEVPGIPAPGSGTGPTPPDQVTAYMSVERKRFASSLATSPDRHWTLAGNIDLDFTWPATPGRPDVVINGDLTVERVLLGRVFELVNTDLEKGPGCRCATSGTTDVTVTESSVVIHDVTIEWQSTCGDVLVDGVSQTLTVCQAGAFGGGGSTP